MTFEFMPVGGGDERLELEFDIGKAPGIGGVIGYGGRMWVRIPSLTAPPKVQKDCHFVSHSLPRNYKHHKGDFDDSGRPLFSSWKEQKDTLARANHGADHDIIYD